MKILIIHNYYSIRGGEENVVSFQKDLFESYGHHVFIYSRDYNELKKWKFGKARGLFSSIYNKKSINDLNTILLEFNPEVAILHNLFPIISPAIIPFLRKKGIRVYQIVHNYRLFCPIGIFYRNGKICHDCMHIGREWNCFFYKCNSTFLASLSFSIRAFLTRIFRYYQKVNKFIVLSAFQKQLLHSNGFKKKSIDVIPNCYIPKFENQLQDINFELKTKIGFIGRLTQEKGFFDFVDLARRLPQYEFQVAGDITLLDKSVLYPKNLIFEGLLNSEQIISFYNRTKVVLLLSRWYEGFPLVLLESMYNFTPLIVTNLGVMPDIINHKINGFVVEPGDFEDIEKYIHTLYQDNELYNNLIIKNNKIVKEHYSASLYYEKMMLAFDKN